MSGSIRANKFCANFLFMTRLPKKRGITQVEEDKSLILRHVLTYLEPVPNLFFHWSGHPPPRSNQPHSP